MELMQAVDSPAFRMYWQPHQTQSVEENIAYARMLKDYTVNVHVLHWKGKEKLSLEEGIDEWRSYIKELPGERFVLLEHMPDHKIESLERETCALRKVLAP